MDAFGGSGMKPQSPHARAPLVHLAVHKGQESNFGGSAAFLVDAIFGNLKIFLQAGQRTAFPACSGLVSSIFLHAGQAHFRLITLGPPDLRCQA